MSFEANHRFTPASIKAEKLIFRADVWKTGALASLTVEELSYGVALTFVDALFTIAATFVKFLALRALSDQFTID